MPARKVDIVFCLDISGSMSPYIDAIRMNIGRMLEQLKNAKFEWRLEFVASSVPETDVYEIVSVRHLRTMDMLLALYHGSANASSDFFTTDVMEFKRALGRLKTGADEDMLCALDTALDMPFGPANETQRVVVLISDEPFETNDPEGYRRAQNQIDAVMKKIQARHVTLFAIMPVHDGELAEKLSMVDRSEFIPIDDEDCDMCNVDMAELLAQMGKTISVTTMQSSGTDKYRRALFNQDKWNADCEFGDYARYQ